MTELSEISAAFRRGRRREAAIVTLWAALLAGAGMSLSESPSVAAPYSILLVLEVMALLSWGGVVGSRALSSVLLGTLPLGASLAAGVVGHACTPSGCVSLCAPFCAVGGVAAGLLLSRMALRSPRPLLSWLSGAALIATTGAIGCACVGSTGVFSMIAGLMVSSVPWSVRLLKAS